MTFTAHSPPPSGHTEDQNKLLDTVLGIVKVQSHHMKNCLNENKLMDGLKYASNMLAELRTSSLAPKAYYQLYLSIFDSLRYLTAYFIEVHQTDKHHLADLYELVQYAGNIIPRLYLMITVGAAYMGLPDAPIREIMRDMMEMTRGVQHPIRGLFLRHYLCGQTRNYLPVGMDIEPNGGIHESIQFTLTNFMEMNKLWIRLQHQGHSRDRSKRDIERGELRILVGTNLERLSQLDGLDLDVYRSAILPELLNEAISCRDVLAQEYLMDVIIQVFPDEFHLHTLQPFLSAIAQLHPKVNIKGIIIALIDRLAAYATRESDLEKELVQQQQQQQQQQKQQQRQHDVPSGPDEQTAECVNQTNVGANDVGNVAEADSHLDGIASDKEDEEMGQVDLGVEEQCIETDIAQHNNENIKDGRASGGEIVNGIPSNVELFKMFWEQIVVFVEARPDLSIEDITELLVSLINLCLSCYPDRLEYVDQILVYCKDKCEVHLNSRGKVTQTTGANLVRLLSAPIQKYESALTLLMLPNYGPLLQQQPYSTRRGLALGIVTNILTKSITISAPEDVHNILELCDILLRDQKDAPPAQIPKAQSSHYDPLPKYTRSHLPEYDELGDDYGNNLSEEQGLIAKLIQLFHSDDDDTQFLLLSAARRQIADGGARIRYTFPSLIFAALKLSHRYKTQDEQNDIWEKKVSTLYRFIHQVITNLYTNSSESADCCLRYYLMAGQNACSSGFEDSAYEFFAQALNVYEESISNSKSQFQAITGIIGALGQTNGFSIDNYNVLITKAALHGSKLLKKPDQCRAVYLASHLWWKTGNDDAGNRKRTLECLQKSLKVADSCMDRVTSLELFVEILNQCIYYYDQGNDAITAKYINGLIDLIEAHLSDLDETDLYPFTSNSSSLLQHDGSAEHVRRYFMSTIRLLKSRQDAEEEGKSKYNDIVLVDMD